MAIKNLYWKRQKQIRNEFPDVFQYETLPREFKIQVVQIWLEDLCACAAYGENEYFKDIVRALRRDFGVWRLPPTETDHFEDDSGELIRFFMAEKDIEKALSVIELTFAKELFIRDDFASLNEPAVTRLNRSVEELNHRFKEHGIGFQLVEDKIICMNSQFTHTEIIKPSLKLLNCEEKIWAGAEEEFLKAHEHYRKGDNKNAIVWCNKAFESVMKAICIKRQWMTSQAAKKATASQLVTMCVNEGLIPEFWKDKYTNGLTVLLKHGVPTGRNNLGSHGQGDEITKVQSHAVCYMLNMTGAAIKFLIEAEEELP